MSNLRRLALQITSLEDRVTPAFAVDDTATIVTFTGDITVNTLVVTATATEVRYQVNGGPVVPLANARPDTLERVVVQAGSAGDTIDLSGLGPNMTAMARAKGGADVTAGAGNDVVRGTQFDDTLDGGAGTDELYAEGGDDTLKARDFESDTLVGGAGHDGAYFESTDILYEVEENNPFAPAPDNQAHKVKVLVLNFDPLIPSQNDAHLYELFPWWNPPQELAAGYQAALERASGGYLQFEITDWRNLNELPIFTDGFRYDPDQYYQNRQTNTGWHLESGADIPRIIREQNVVPLVDAGLVDEVWFFGDHFFALGGESFMMGPGSFFINGPTYPEVPSSRPFVGYGFSYERAVAEMLHNTGHRAENHGNRTYGGWNLANPQNNWDKFSANVTQSNGVAGVGTCHYPPNATGDYDYGNATVVQSWADDYLDYPNLPFTPRPINVESWAHGDGDTHRTYLEWYFGHFPRNAGVGPDGKQNNWFKYNWDFNNYEPGGAKKPFRAAAQLKDLFNLGGPDHTFRVAYSSPTPVDVSTINSADVRVTGPNGFDQLAELVSVSDPSNGTHRVATYRVSAPGGAWTSAHAGQYTVALRAGEVTDTLGAALAGQTLGAFRIRTASAEPLPNDADTGLLLRLNGDLAGAGGEAAIDWANVVYEPGVVGDAAHFGDSGYAKYPVAGNVAPTAGTVEFWIKPDWNATDPGNHAFFSVGNPFNRAILLQFDDWADWAKLMLWGDNPSTGPVETNWERNFVFPINWRAGEWHHLAATWDMATRTMSMYVDGRLAATLTDTPILTGFSTTDLAVGGQVNAPNAGGLGTYDEVRVSTRARSAGEIMADYQAGIATTGLTVTPDAVPVAIGDRRQLTATATSASGVTVDVTAQVTWATDNPAVATVDATGRVLSVAAGSATITATFGALTDTAAVTVTNTNRPTAALQPVADITDVGGTELLLTVVYDDDAALNAATFDDRDVWVHSANGFSQYGTFVTATPGGNGRPRTATYRITPPGAVWDERDNGTYVVELTDWQVGDTTGEFAAARELGQFAVRIVAEPPTDVALSNAAVDENQPADTEVGTLSATDPTPGEALAFTLVDDAGGRFRVVGDKLRTAVPLNFESATTHPIRVRVTDAAGNWFEEAFTIQVGNVNEAPTGVGLAPASMAEGVALGTPVGNLLAADPDAGDTFTYELVAGPGGDDNGSFAIVDGHLVTAAPVDFEEQSSYAVRVRATDALGLATEAALTIAVSDENPERPTLDNRPTIILPAILANAKNPVGAAVAALVANADDDDAPAAVGVAITGTSGKGMWQFSPNGTAWTAVAPVTSASALLLDRSWQVRFVPARGFNGFAGLTYTAWDGQTGTAGTRVDPATTPIGFSADAEKAWVAVGRTVPKIDAAGRPLLNPVREDAKGGAGNPIKTILGLLARELGVVTPLGIAVTGASPTGGTWQYSITGGRKWENVGTVGDTAGLLLRPQDRLRFVPSPDFDGEATVTYRTWNLFGAPGGRVPVTGTGFSPTTETAIADVRPVNDRPVLDLSRAAVVGPVAAGGASTPVPFGSLMSATDVDNTAIGVAVVKAAGPGTWHYRPAGGSAMVLPPVSSGKAILLAADTEVWFEAADDTPAGTAALSFRAWDGSNRKPAGSRVPVGGTSFSKQVEVLTAAVGNTRPTLNNLIVPEPKFTDVIAGAKPGAGDLVKTLLGTAVTDTDTDPGIALTFADNTNGTWWYSLGGNRWVPVGAVGLGAALLLPGTARLRFVPAAGFTGAATIEYRAWDRTAGIALDRIDTDGGLDSFSTAIETATVTVV